MLRFLLFRILASIPVLFVLSLLTFIIIQAPPGDYGDYLKSQLMLQDNMSMCQRVYSIRRNVAFIVERGEC